MYSQDSATPPFYRWGNSGSKRLSNLPNTTQLLNDWTIIQTQSRGSQTYALDHQTISQHYRIPVCIELWHVSESPGGLIKTDCWAHRQSPQVMPMGSHFENHYSTRWQPCLSFLRIQRPCTSACTCLLNDSYSRLALSGCCRLIWGKAMPLQTWWGPREGWNNALFRNAVQRTWRKQVPSQIPRLRLIRVN